MWGKRTEVRRESLVIFGAGHFALGIVLVVRKILKRILILLHIEHTLLNHKQPNHARMKKKGVWAS